ncbi:hypothetical protein V4C85_07715 [Ralstonia solanacearum]|uniref:hypothetical protein n=1 Tax=Ralstonia solanacearum TaxID=305 RepID=UPI0007C9025F|nr:hypothetical protein [Ralstonia solanacearum]OAI63337.1 hypothetical protein RSP597_21410 [Ralstonia solanacearum]
MDRDLLFPAPAPATAHPIVQHQAQARLLTHRDLPALLELEHEKWDTRQAASRADLGARIDAHPDLAVGAFCSGTGRLLASLFMKPVANDFHHHVRTWKDCVQTPAAHGSASLFGISLSSRAQAGVDAILRFFWPRALKEGWRHIYLGSPVPGLRTWLRGRRQTPVEDYVRARRAGLPIDPQLRYYRSRGFTKIVAVKPGYFPHERSLDYGVLLRGTVPLSTLAPLWSALPLASVQRVTRPLAALL